MKRHLHPCQSPPYSNCAAYPPDEDVVIFRCNAGKMDFYLRRGLAELIQENPPIIRLKFKPKGRGHEGDPYFTQALRNVCVVCGSEKDLSRHHIVPWIYRKWCFPRDQERNWSYDVLALCVRCHSRYERFAIEFKKEIHREYGVPLDGWNGLTAEETQVSKACAALRKHRDQIPIERRRILEDIVRDYLGKAGDLSPEDLLVGQQIFGRAVSHSSAEMIGKRVKDPDEFAIRWRSHFVKFMKPRFLPPYWDPQRRVYSEADART